jgi:hypothetical protein
MDPTVATVSRFRFHLHIPISARVIMTAG